MLLTQDQDVNPDECPIAFAPNLDLQAKVELAVSRAIRKTLEQAGAYLLISADASSVVEGMRDADIEDHALWDPVVDEGGGPRDVIKLVASMSRDELSRLRIAAAAGVEYAFTRAIAYHVERAVHAHIQSRKAEILKGGQS